MKNKAVAFIVRNEIIPGFGNGEYNGYVAVPPTNKYYSKHYDDINDIEVHGGITLSEPVISGETLFCSKRAFAPEYVGLRNPLLGMAEYLTDDTEIGDDWWIFGFDTYHWGDNKDNWSKKTVISETLDFMKQLN